MKTSAFKQGLGTILFMAGAYFMSVAICSYSGGRPMPDCLAFMAWAKNNDLKQVACLILAMLGPVGVLLLISSSPQAATQVLKDLAGPPASK